MGADKGTVLKQLQQSENIYVILSKCTRMPFVLCDPETYDDEILIYFDEKGARDEEMRLNASGNPVLVVTIEKKGLLSFYSGLYPMGVNCLTVNKGMHSEIGIQLKDLVRRPDADKIQKGPGVIENPSLHLTGLYFIQEFRKEHRTALTPELEEMQEELLAHYRQGTFIIPLRADSKGVVIIKNTNGISLLPVFTDGQEFMKFQMANPKEKFAAGVVQADKVVGLLPADAEAVVLNPLSSNIPLNVERRRK